MRWLQQIPITRYLLPFLAGVLLSTQFKAVMPLWVLLLLWAIHFLYSGYTRLYIKRFRFLAGILASGLLICLGFAGGNFQRTSEFRPENNIPFWERGANFHLVELTDLPIKTLTGFKVQGQLKLSSNSTAEQNDGVQLYLYDTVAVTLLPGDQIYFFSRLNALYPKVNPFGFDYNDYLRKQGVLWQAFLKNKPVSYKVDNGYSFNRMLAVSRRYLLAKFKLSQFEVVPSAILSALVLGEKSDLPDEVRETFGEVGALHVLAVSGLHVGILFILLTWLSTRLILGNHPLLRFLFITVFLSIYCLLTGMSPSVLRATLMFTFIAFATQFNKHTSIYNTVLASALVLIIANPRIITEVGFQLSYAAVLGIIYLQPKFARYYEAPNKFIQFFWNLTCVTFAAQIATAPIAVYYFGYFPTYFFLSNLVVIPAVIGLLYGGFVFLLIAELPVLGEWSAWLLNWAVKLLVMTLGIVQQFPYAVVENINLFHWEVVAVYALLFFLLAWVALKKESYFRYFAIALALFLMMEIGQDIHLNERRGMVVYQHPKNTVIQIIAGRRSTVYFDSFDSLDVNWIKFNVEPFMKDLGLKSIKYVQVKDSGFVNDELFLKNIGENRSLVSTSFASVSIANSYVSTKSGVENDQVLGSQTGSLQIATKSQSLVRFYYPKNSLSRRAIDCKNYLLSLFTSSTKRVE